MFALEMCRGYAGFPATPSEATCRVFQKQLATAVAIRLTRSFTGAHSQVNVQQLVLGTPGMVVPVPQAVGVYV